MQMSLSMRQVVFFVVTCHHAVAGPDESRLLRKKFKDDEYMPWSRPVSNDSETLMVNFGISLLQIREVDMKNELLRANLWLQYKWRDSQLAWNESQFGGVSRIVVPASSVWTPDILLYNSADEDIDSKVSTNVVVWSDGRCDWIPPGLFESSCAMDITWFPFDDQVCTLKFGSWTYNGWQLNLQPIRDGFDLSNYIYNGEWMIVDAPVTKNVKYYPCCVAPYPDLTFRLRLRRRALYYNLYLIVPTGSVAGLSLLTFLLPPDSGEKVGLGITVLLSMTVFQLMIAENVPESSDGVPLIAMFIGVVMFFCTFSLVMSVVVLNLHYRTPKTHHMPNWVRVVFCDWLAWLLRMKRSGHDVTLKSLLDKNQTERRFSIEDKLSTHDTHLPIVNKLNKEVKSDDTIGDSGDGGGPTSLQSQLAAILAELRLLTFKMREDSKDKKTSSEWKFVATVVDRLCFCTFAIFSIIAIIVVFRHQFF